MFLVIPARLECATHPEDSGLLYPAKKNTLPGVSCDSGATRTRDPQLRRLLLYPTELRNLIQAAKIHYFSDSTSRKHPPTPFKGGIKLILPISYN